MTVPPSSWTRAASEADAPGAAGLGRGDRGGIGREEDVAEDSLRILGHRAAGIEEDHQQIRADRAAEVEHVPAVLQGFEFREDLAEALLERAIDDDPEGTTHPRLCHQDDRLPEIGIGHAAPRHKENAVRYVLSGNGRRRSQEQQHEAKK